MKCVCLGKMCAENVSGKHLEKTCSILSFNVRSIWSRCSMHLGSTARFSFAGFSFAGTCNRHVISNCNAYMILLEPPLEELQRNSVNTCVCFINHEPLQI